MIYNQPIAHYLVGKRVDFDFRAGDSFAAPYNKTINCQVWQDVMVNRVSVNTDGKVMLHFTQDGPGFALNTVNTDKKTKKTMEVCRVVRIYD